jgi:hypothetical protein
MIEDAKRDIDESRDITTSQMRRMSLQQQGIKEIEEKSSDVDKNIYLLGDLPQKYLPGRDTDSMSIKFDQDVGKFYIGNYNYFNINGNDLEFENSQGGVTGTEGLWMLLTRKDPVNSTRWHDEYSVSSSDLTKYNTLMYYFNAYKHPKTGKRLASSNSKYTQIIKPYVDKREKAELNKSKNASNSSVSGSGINKNHLLLNSWIKFLPSDTNSLKQRLYVILGNIQAKHTNITVNDIHEAFEIVDYLKNKNLLSPVSYSNIYGILSNQLVCYNNKSLING